MAIITENTGKEHVLRGATAEAIASVLEPVVLFTEEDERGFDMCNYQNIVLADATGEENQNDINSFLFKLSNINDTLVLTLEKVGTIYDIVLDGSANLGTFYDKNTINYYDEQLLYTGYTLNWADVLAKANYGIGNYRIKAELTSFGSTTTSYSGCYTLREFSTAIADSTIRIESYMNGYMLRKGINYKGINLVDMIRVKGFFGDAEEEQTITNDLYASLSGEDRVVSQRKVNVLNIYNFETQMLPKCIADKIRYYHFFANEVYISDYNSDNYDYGIKRIKIYKEEAFEFEYPKISRKIIIKGKLKEQVQDNQKTNYF